MDNRYLIESRIHEHKAKMMKVNKEAYKKTREKKQIQPQQPSFVEEIRTFVRAVFQ